MRGGVAAAEWCPTPLLRIMKAKRKPDGVSDVRWRMELSRRRMCGRDGNVEFVRDPDAI